MDATEMFLVRHKRMRGHIERLTEDLREAQIRESVLPTVNPIAWLLWHIARSEDSAMNLLVTEGREVLDVAWCTRMNVSRRDAGTGMTMDEVMDLSARVHLPSLTAYGRAVGERTAGLVSSMTPLDLGEVVSPEAVHRAVVQLVAEPMRAALEELWQETRRGDFLIWLPLTHNYEHIGQVDLIRGMLGHSGRF